MKAGFVLKELQSLIWIWVAEEGIILTWINFRLVLLLVNSYLPSSVALEQLKNSLASTAVYLAKTKKKKKLLQLARIYEINIFQVAANQI